MSQKNIPEADADQEIEDSVAMGPEGEASRAGSARETIVNEQEKSPAGRRSFLTAIAGAMTVAVAAITTSVLRIRPSIASENNDTGDGKQNKQYGMVIDTRRCIGCPAKVNSMYRWERTGHGWNMSRRGPTRMLAAAFCLGSVTIAQSHPV